MEVLGSRTTPTGVPYIWGGVDGSRIVLSSDDGEVTYGVSFALSLSPSNVRVSDGELASDVTLRRLLWDASDADADIIIRLGDACGTRFMAANGI